MSDSVERLVNLALYLAQAGRAVTWIDIRDDVAGYPPDQEEASFRRMLERDKEDLREAGFAIICDEDGSYTLDRAATYVAPLKLSPAEAAAVTTAGVALLDDPSFPFADDLRLALAKLSAEMPSASVSSVGALLADEAPEQQASLVAELSKAATARKRVTFVYTNTQKATAARDVDPYGLFLHDGRWYLVGRDVAKGDIRTYAIARVEELRVNTARPKSPDFDRPADFDLARFVRLPFQFGDTSDQFETTLRLSDALRGMAASLMMGQGELVDTSEGQLWRVAARSPERLLRFVVEHGPGIEILEPTALRAQLSTSLERVEASHGQA